MLDSSAFLSIEDRNDRSHEVASRTLEDLLASGTDVLTTNFIFDETHTLLLSRLGRDRAVDWGTRLRAEPAIRTIRVSEDHESRAWEIILTFSDKTFSYTDATTFAVAEALDIDTAFAFDQHFVQYGGFRVVPG